MTIDIDNRAIATIRTLAADVVQKANSGHPGAPMGCAPMAHTLFTQHIRANPKNPTWPNRDRFVLSNGHACALQYIMLHLLGYDLSMDDLKRFRQIGSKTPGHPEANHGIPGIEVTTGPLGQGIASAVGIALAETHMAATFNRPEFKIFDNYTFAITGDGCLQEGVQAEAISLAGHLKLGKLIVLYDDNSITIDGDTAVSFTEDACGWHTSYVVDGNENVAAISSAINAAKLVLDKPSLIRIKTTIGFGSKNQGEEKVHGAPLGAEDIVEVKKKFGFDISAFFVVPQGLFFPTINSDVYSFYHNIAQNGAKLEQEWNSLFATYKSAHPELAAELTRRLENKLPMEKLQQALPRYTPSDPAVATRKLSENVLNKIADILPELIGGSADLTGSNLTRWKTAKDYQAHGSKLGDVDGRYIRYGVREHGMAAMSNGICSYGGLIPFCSTFFNFISYAMGAVRLSALSKQRVLYIMTHDSIGLGEDGPTHQVINELIIYLKGILSNHDDPKPIETLAMLRALPNILTFRPADGNETSGCYLQALIHDRSPSVLILTRQNLPHFSGSSIEAVAKGAYVIQDEKSPQLILAATGSEVSLAIDTAKELDKQGIKALVVSMPSFELFEMQSWEYKAEIFPRGIPVLSIEAMTTFGWSKYAHASIGIDTFGASAPIKDVYAHFELVPVKIAEKAVKFVSHYKDVVPEFKMQNLF